MIFVLIIAFGVLCIVSCVIEILLYTLRRTPTIGTIYVEEDGLFYCSIDSEKDLEKLKSSKDVRFRVRIKK